MADRILKVTKITVLTGLSGPDQVHLYTDLPCPTWPFEGPMVVRFETPPGKGVEYVKEHFSIEPTVVDARG